MNLSYIHLKYEISFNKYYNKLLDLNLCFIITTSKIGFFLFGDKFAQLSVKLLNLNRYSHQMLKTALAILTHEIIRKDYACNLTS